MLARMLGVKRASGGSRRQPERHENHRRSRSTSRHLAATAQLRDL